MTAGSVSFRHFALGLLSQQPMSGYDIKRYLKVLSWLIDGPSFSNIYPSLHLLLQEGMVTVEIFPQENRPSRKVYSVTEAGRQMLREWAEQPVAANSSLKAFVMRLTLAGSFSQARLIAHLEQRRNQVSAHQAALEQTAASRDGAADIQRLMLEYGMALAAAELEWLDSTLDRLAKQPLPAEVVQGN
jgi:DNA-binding PadR family transcriptional regulator